jgi:hypothetical protein
MRVVRLRNRRHIPCPLLVERGHAVEYCFHYRLLTNRRVDHEVKAVPIRPFNTKILHNERRAVAIHGFDKLQASLSLFPPACSRRTFVGAAWNPGGTHRQMNACKQAFARLGG